MSILDQYKKILDYFNCKDWVADNFLATVRHFRLTSNAFPDIGSVGRIDKKKT